MFDNMKRAINAHFDAAAADFSAGLEHLTCKEAAQSWYYTERMTKKAMELIKEQPDGAAIPAYAKAKMLLKFNRENEQSRASYLAKLTAAEQAPAFDGADISVEWKRNSTWGNNPTATVRAYGYSTTTGHASGCGYDKESAAVASAMNDNLVILRILYEHAEAGNTFPYGVSSYAGVPHFDGGVGVNCFAKVFAVCGYKWRTVASGKTYDAYTIEKA